MCICISYYHISSIFWSLSSTFFIEVCDPACKYGKCVNGKCECEMHFAGKACDKGMDWTENYLTFNNWQRLYDLIFINA